MENGSELRGFLTGILWGSLIGLAAGIMLAPQSGEITRKELKEKLKQLTEQISDLLSEAGEGVDKLISRLLTITAGEESVRKKVEKIRTELEEIKAATD